MVVFFPFESARKKERIINRIKKNGVIYFPFESARKKERIINRIKKWCYIFSVRIGQKKRTHNKPYKKNGVIFSVRKKLHLPKLSSIAYRIKVREVLYTLRHTAIGVDNKYHLCV